MKKGSKSHPYDTATLFKLTVEQNFLPVGTRYRVLGTCSEGRCCPAGCG